MADKSMRRKLKESIRSMSIRSWRMEGSVYEGHDDETRLLLIGSALNAAVEDNGRIAVLSEDQQRQRASAWAASHPHEAEWLEDQGLTVDDARRHHADWMAKKDAWMQKAGHVGIDPRR